MTSVQKNTRSWRTLITFIVVGLILPIGILGLGVVNNHNTIPIPGTASWRPLLGYDFGGGTMLVLEPLTSDESDAGVEAESDVALGQAQQAAGVIRARLADFGLEDAVVQADGSAVTVGMVNSDLSTTVVTLATQQGRSDMRSVLLSGWGQPGPADPFVDIVLGGDDADVDAGDGDVDSDGDATDAASDTDASDAASTSVWAEAGNLEDPWSLDQISDSLMATFESLDCQSPVAFSQMAPADDADVVVACSTDGMTKYILGPVVVPNQNVAGAALTSQANDQNTFAQTGQLETWWVTLLLNSEGRGQLTQATTRITEIQAEDPTDSRQSVAVMFDGFVVAAPLVENINSSGRLELPGTFTELGARVLASQLNHGALPQSLQLASVSAVSATWASGQLQGIVLALAIALVLALAWFIVRYRALATIPLVTMALYGLMVYVVAALLGWAETVYITMPSIAAALVTGLLLCESFITMTQRFRDAIAEGRGVGPSMQRAWQRSLRSVYAPRVMLAIVSLGFYFAADGVLHDFGFALLVTTILSAMFPVWVLRPLLTIAAHRAMGKQVPAATQAKARQGSVQGQTIAQKRAMQAGGAKLLGSHDVADSASGKEQQ